MTKKTVVLVICINQETDIPSQQFLEPRSVFKSKLCLLCQIKCKLLACPIFLSLKFELQSQQHEIERAPDFHTN